MYDAELDGQDVTFGTSGFLYQNNKLMYDRPTDTLWHSLTGEPVIGELAHSGKKLNRFPVTVTTWQEWLEQHPDTTVLSLDTGFEKSGDPSKKSTFAVAPSLSVVITDDIEAGQAKMRRAGLPAALAARLSRGR